MSFKLKWTDGKSCHSLKIRSRKPGILIYEDEVEEAIVISFTDFDLFDAVEWPASAEVLEYITWSEVRIPLSRLSQEGEMMVEMKAEKLVRFRWTVAPDGRKFPYYHQLPTLPQVLWNAAVGLFFMTESAASETKEIIDRIRRR